MPLPGVSVLKSHTYIYNFASKAVIATRLQDVQLAKMNKGDAAKQGVIIIVAPTQFYLALLILSVNDK
tara:strand:- start:2145 stop:2348 length:204 start_codon:yes stop_codon:yes gene_type:complete